MKNLHVIVIKLQNYINTIVLKPIPIYHKLQLPSSFCQFIVMITHEKNYRGTPFFDITFDSELYQSKSKLNVNLPILLTMGFDFFII